MRVHALCLALLCCATSGAQAQESSEAPARPLALLDHQRLNVAMAEVVTQWPELVAQLGVGSSRAQRTIGALRLAAGELSPGRPAILLVAGLEGGQAYTSSVALDVTRKLAAAYGEDEAVTRFLERTTLYVIPRANPDAAEGRFANPRIEVRATGHGVDNDRDAIAGPPGAEGQRPMHGEDDRADVNQDGWVSWMRVEHPEGEWIADDTDPRAMRRADPTKGERGRWKLLPEGQDADGDGEVAEDPIHDAEVNRNFPAEWEEHTARAGLFATDEPEVRALCSFLRSSRDIQLVVVFGEQDNLRGEMTVIDDDAPATYRVPKAGVLRSDAALLEELARRYEELGEAHADGIDDDRAGTFATWAYAHRGLPTVEACLWEVPLDASEPESGAEAPEGAPEEPEEKKEIERSEDAKRLLWIDQNTAGDEAAFPSGRHLGWTAFDHPDLGAVEVGGFAPFALCEPPAGALGPIADRQRDFLLGLGESLARVRLTDVRARELGGDLVELTAVLQNDGLLPLFTRSGLRTRTGRPARVKLRVPSDAKLLAGRAQVLVSELDGMGGRHELRWLIQGAPPETIGVSVVTDNAGAAQARAEVTR